MNTPSIRLFENDFLESLTHVHPIVPLMLWSPVVGTLLWRSLYVHDLPVYVVLALIIPALLVWTLTEYLVHRFAFHYRARTPLGKWLVFLFHGVHHEAPSDKTRLVMPPAGAVLIMAIFYLIFRLLIPATLVEAFFALFLVGYLGYDYTHYAMHHFRMRHPMLKALKHRHMKHHFNNSKAGFGVSSPLWDWVFGTLH